MLPVLIADNSRSVLKILSGMLENRLGAKVVCSLSLNDALLAIQEEGPFLVGIFGTVLADATADTIVEQAVQHIPTVIFTSRVDAATQEAMWSRGIVDYVAKESMESFEHVTSLVRRLHHNPEVNILVAHKRQLLRQRVRGLLERQNYQVVEACDQNQVFQQLQEHDNIRLLLLDATLEHDATTRMLNKIRQAHSQEELAVMVFAGPEDGHNVARLIKFGAGGSISQEFTPEELYSRVSLNLDMLETLGRLRDMAIRDELTRAYNRRHLLQRAEEEFERANRHSTDLSVIMIDADHFKNVNDTYGHDVGDEVLRQLTRTAEKQLRRSDLLARFGGEEFVVLAPETDLDGAVDLAERIRRSIDALRIPVDEGELRFTVSLGVAQATASDQSVESTLKKADQALYQAKEQGRNRVFTR